MAEFTGAGLDAARNAYWSDKLKCMVIRIKYDFAERRGTVSMAEHNCVDMVGVVEMFEAIDPHVVKIETWAARVLDTTFLRLDNGWNAIQPKNRKVVNTKRGKELHFKMPMPIGETQTT